MTWLSATCSTSTAHIESKHTHTQSPSQYCVESSINGTNLSSREFLVGCLILGLSRTETVCSIVRPCVRVYSHLALNGAITLYFQTGEQWQSEILTCSFCWGSEKGRVASSFLLKQRTIVSYSEKEMTLTVCFSSSEKRGLTHFFCGEMDIERNHSREECLESHTELCNYCFL